MKKTHTILGLVKQYFMGVTSIEVTKHTKRSNLLKEGDIFDIPIKIKIPLDTVVGYQYNVGRVIRVFYIIDGGKK